MQNNINYNDKDARVRFPFITESIALALIPFEEVLALPVGSVLRLVNFATLFFCFMSFKNIRISRGKNFPVFPMMFFVIYIAVSFLWCYNRTYYIDRLSTYGLYAMLIFLLCFLRPTAKEKISMLNGLMLGGAAAAFMIVFTGASLNIGGRETLVILGRMIDPNVLSYSCVISLVVCLYRMFVERKLIIIHSAVLTILFTAIVICGSRGAMITTFVTIAVITLNIDVKRNKFIKRAAAFIFVCIAVLFVYYEFVLTSEFGTRFTVDNLVGQGDMGMANRDKIWSAAFTQIAKRPFFGYGNGASMYAIEKVYRFYGTHNTYIFLLLEFGIVGTVMAFIWQINEYRALRNNKCKIYKILFLSVLIFVIFVEGFSTKVFWGLQVLLMTACYGENVDNSLNAFHHRGENK